MSAIATTPTRSPANWLRFAFCLTGVAIVWIVVLPWLSSRPAMQEHLDWLQEKRIDPSAMYYTELESMQPVLEKLNERQRFR